MNSANFFSLRGVSSFPYLSGYTWTFFCDWKMLNVDRASVPVRFNAEDVKDQDAIYLDYSCVADFAKRILPKIDGRVILISSNYGLLSDYALPGPFSSLLDNEKVIAWFVQNLDRPPTEKLIPIPIGLASRYWEHGNTEMFDRYIPLGKDQRSTLCYINFTMRKERIDCARRLRAAGFPFAERRSFEEYLQQLTDTVFVVSPPGNGLDCHRTWEALLMGCYPIVQSNTLDPLYKDLPVVIVRDWSEVTIPFLLEKKRELESRAFSRDKLYAPYWFEKVNSLRSRSVL